jgi:hypothetical protein
MDRKVLASLAEKDGTEAELMQAVKAEKSMVEAVRDVIRKYI